MPDGTVHAQGKRALRCGSASLRLAAIFGPGHNRDRPGQERGIGPENAHHTALACGGWIWQDSSMRRVVVCNIVSVDGFYAARDGNPLVLNMDAAFDAYNRVRIEAADLLLLGRKSYEGFSSYWPGIASAPEDPGNRAVSEDNRRVSRAYNALPKSVVSDTFVVPADSPWRDTTTVVPGGGLPGWIAARRHEGDGDILVFASRVLWNSLLSLGLVDELHLMVSPHALAEGIPVFTQPAAFTLLDSVKFGASSNVLLRYQLNATADGGRSA